MPAPLLTERQAAERLGLQRATLEKWRVLGCGPEYLKLGRAVRYQPAALEEFIASRRRRSTSGYGTERDAA
ncbi:MAG: helix-turn-helix domain-containing protein [Thermoanaerobaculia bacterium]|nr:helix-turn-helix domain-containing protein [Thermoanaerobaculia bacterium]